MNASKILEQLMQQAGGSKTTGSQGAGSGGVDVKGVLEGLSRQFGSGSGSQSGGGSGGQSGGGIDVKSLLGGGALGMLVGSKRGRKLGGKALKYGALAGVGVLAWKAWQNYQGNPGNAGGSQSGASPSEGEPVERPMAISTTRSARCSASRSMPWALTRSCTTGWRSRCRRRSMPRRWPARPTPPRRPARSTWSAWR